MVSGDDTETKLNVIPDLVDKLSIRTVGSSESFNITWSAVLNVNYGTVFYEVQLDGPHTNYSSVSKSFLCAEIRQKQDCALY